MSRLALHLLGRPRIERDGESIKTDRRKAIALLVYLAVTGRGHSRDSLATLFWPEHDRSTARAGLRRALSALRKTLGGDWLEADRERVALVRLGEYWLDVDAFHERLAECKAHGHLPRQTCPVCLQSLAEAIKLYRDDFLAGFTLRDCARFDDWQFFQTEGLRRDLANALEGLAYGHGAQGEYERAISYARRWVELDPLHETAHRQLMRLYAWSGQRSAAVRQYEICRGVLAEELGVETAEETAALFQQVRLGTLQHPVPSYEPPPEIMPTHAPTLDLSGKTLKDYQVMELVGQGGIACVYRARQVRLQRDVALKVALTAVAADPTVRKRFEREAQAVAALKHPNIITLYDIGETDDGRPYMVLEFVHGRVLRDRLKEEMALKEALEIAAQVADGLAYAHEKGVIHLDVKPNNILLAEDDLPLLTDMGWAMPILGDRGMKASGVLLGTAEYVSPECAQGLAVDGRADIYALGVVLFQMLTGRHPYEGETGTSVLIKHVEAPMPRPSHFNPSVPPALDEIVLKATAKSPEERYQRAGEMADDLRSVLASGVDAEAAADSTIIDPTGILRGIELREPIGSGGFGEVYRAYQPSVAREVAVKVVLPRFAKHPDFVRRFEKEAQLVARLEHPHIVPLYDYWRDADGAYLVMRLMQGGNLCDALAHGPWDVEAAAHLLDQIAGALDVAHRQGVVHRDVKPENILLDHDGNAYLSDFGIAKDLVDATATTDPDAVPGSLWYISPEQAQSAPVTPQSDLYSLGIVMYEVLTGEHPFSGLTPPDQLIRRLTEPLPPLADRRPGLPAALNEVVQQVTAKDPVERFPDVPTFARAFRLALAGTVVEIADPARHLDVDVDSTGGQRTAIQ